MLNAAGLSESGRCPVCQARFRSEAVCSRCGADLMPLMLLLTQLVSQREDLRQQAITGPKTGRNQSEKGDEKRAHRGSHTNDRMFDRISCYTCRS